MAVDIPGPLPITQADNKFIMVVSDFHEMDGGVPHPQPAGSRNSCKANG